MLPLRSDTHGPTRARIAGACVREVARTKQLPASVPAREARGDALIYGPVTSSCAAL
jgi:hypothetical protein